MSKRPRPQYTDKNSTQTLREGLEEYYAVNPGLTNPSLQPANFAKIMLAHDASHVIYGLDTDMYDELKLLPLCFWTSDFKFSDYLDTVKNPEIKPAISIMYDDLMKQHGVIWLYTSILVVLPRLVPEMISMWVKTRKRQNFIPYLEFEPLRECSLLDIRQEFELLPFIK
jgi:hypothetical protein